MGAQPPSTMSDSGCSSPRRRRRPRRAGRWRRGRRGLCGTWGTRLGGAPFSGALPLGPTVRGATVVHPGCPMARRQGSVRVARSAAMRARVRLARRRFCAPAPRSSTIARGGRGRPWRGRGRRVAGRPGSPATRARAARPPRPAGRQGAGARCLSPASIQACTGAERLAGRPGRSGGPAVLDGPRGVKMPACTPGRRGATRCGRRSWPGVGEGELDGLPGVLLAPIEVLELEVDLGQDAHGQDGLDDVAVPPGELQPGEGDLLCGLDVAHREVDEPLVADEHAGVAVVRAARRAGRPQPPDGLLGVAAGEGDPGEAAPGRDGVVDVVVDAGGRGSPGRGPPSRRGRSAR